MPEGESGKYNLEEFKREWIEKHQKLSSIIRPYLESSGKKDVADKFDSLPPELVDLGYSFPQVYQHYFHWVEKDIGILTEGSEEKKKAFIEWIEGMVHTFESMKEMILKAKK